MPLLKYKPYNPKGSARKAIADANRILEDFERQGYKLTLRQLYYQFIGHDLFGEDRRYVNVGGNKWKRSDDETATKNAPPNYDWLGKVISRARDAGMVDWKHIEDRTRSVKSLSHWDNKDDFMRSVVPQYKHDLWLGQETRVMVFVEKEALSQVIGKPAIRWDVPYFANKGYLSSSSAWNVARNMMLLHENHKEIQKWIILHLGDHDPSGIDMTRDITDRIGNYARPSDSDTKKGFEFLNIEVRRLALTMTQVTDNNLPPDPAKQTDARYRDYEERFGDESWELDALDPSQIDELIEDEIEGIVDYPMWEERRDLQTQYRCELLDAAGIPHDEGNPTGDFEIES